MEMPNIPRQMRDAERNIVYTVLAYRQLSQAEVLAAIRAYLSQQKRKPAKNKRDTIITTLGATGSL
jgi:hypothetical protein